MRWRVLTIIALLLTGYAVGQTTVSFPTEDGGVVYADVYSQGGRAVVLAHAESQTSNSFDRAAEFKKKAKRVRSSESLPGGMLCNQYNLECDGKSAMRIRAKFRGCSKQKTIVNL